LSDVVGGILFGFVWLLVLGLAYRRHVARSFWLRPLALAFYSVFAIAALWHAPRSVDAKLAAYATPPPPRVLATEAWWQTDWTRLPAQRNETGPGARWELDIQYAGTSATLQRVLQQRGWRLQPQAGWVETLGLLDDDRTPAQHAILPATLEGRPESLLFVRMLGANDAIVLRVWLAPKQLHDGPPLWIGASQRVHHSRPLKFFGLWRPVANDGNAHAYVAQDLSGMSSIEALHPMSTLPVLRVRER
jgi:hypothetical protein